MEAKITQIQIDTDKLNGLSQLEKQIFEKVSSCRSSGGDVVGNKELAEKLGFSRNEVSRARNEMRKKLGLPAGF